MTFSLNFHHQEPSTLVQKGIQVTFEETKVFHFKEVNADLELFMVYEKDSSHEVKSENITAKFDVSIKDEVFAVSIK